MEPLLLNHSEAAAGRELIYHRADLPQPCVVTFFKASLGQEEEGKLQYAAYPVATDTRIVEQMVNANQVEHTTNRILRLIVEGILVTDEKSLYEHIHVTGSLPVSSWNHCPETGKLSLTQAQEQHLAKAKMKAAKMANMNVLYGF